MFRRTKTIKNFEASPLRESDKTLVNPMRGWYSIFYFVLREDTDWIEVERRMRCPDTLAMVFIDIGAASKESLTEKDLNEIRQILDYFKKNDMDIILRIAYDHEGRCMEKEPAGFSVIEKHAAQIVNVVNEYDNIFVLQGLLLGNWGEMHSSRYLNDAFLRKIADIFSGCKTNLSVRKPLQWRILNENYWKEGKQTFEKMGLFDDAMFASETDMGTFSHDSKENVGYRSEWCRTEEIEFYDEIGKRNPIGGEIVYGEGYSENLSFSKIKDEMAKMHVTYLGKEYDRKVLDNFKNVECAQGGIWSGKTGYDYIEAHLGYRFVVESVSVRRNRDKSTVVEITVCNKGFAPIYSDADVLIEIDDNDCFEFHRVKNGLNDIFPGEKKTVSATFKQQVGLVGTYGFVGDKVIEFANEGNKDNITILGRID